MDKYSTINQILNNSLLNDDIEQTASSFGIPFKDLLIKALLHLPRFSEKELRDFQIIQPEVRRHAAIIAQNYLKHRLPTLPVDLCSIKPDDLAVELIYGQQAAIMLKYFHYLNSVREESINIGLKHLPSRTVVGVISISQFDLYHVDIAPYTSQEVAVVSRIYTNGGLPRNSVSRFIRRCKEWLRVERPYIKILLTYLNPNVGYKGSIYKATNWTELAREWNVRYNYYHDNYVTDRFLVKHFGTCDAHKLAQKRIQAISFSQINLHPLKIYACRLDNQPVDMKAIQYVHVERS